ncbi:MAG: ECF-type sigma factor [Lysobacterales bacterium]
MTTADANEITGLLARWPDDSQARDRAVSLLFNELRQLARREFSGQIGNTLQPTALINEAMLKMLGGAPAGFESRRHFFGAAARAMRQVLVDRARRKATDKRNAGERPLSLDEALDVAVPAADDLIALDEALRKLEQHDERAARLVELRYFAGMTLDETAQVLELHPATVSSEWAHARAWLRHALGDAA